MDGRQATKDGEGNSQCLWHPGRRTALRIRAVSKSGLTNTYCTRKISSASLFHLFLVKGPARGDILARVGWSRKVNRYCPCRPWLGKSALPCIHRGSLASSGRGRGYPVQQNIAQETRPIRRFFLSSRGYTMMRVISDDCQFPTVRPDLFSTVFLPGWMAKRLKRVIKRHT
ncbi:hypothetical protein LY76DRAFT_256944 [Colletotrichum caudatum]|nr:hypothetical protein LY76DRAFT_256944 [Colletotrichum caudatum]